MTIEPDTAAHTQAYSYKPSLLGAAWEFKLVADRLEWSTGRQSGRVALRDVRRVRMSYRPANMQRHRFVTEVWADGAPKLQIVSSSWKSLVEQERLDRPYSAFVAELHRRLAQAGAAASFEQGTNRLIYWPGLAVFAGVAVGLAGLVAHALQSDAIGGAAFIGAFLLLFLWQGGNFFRRNRPGTYRPDAPPPELLPQGATGEWFAR
ncbi:MAG: hypothetical protein HY543_12305 [Deltaproteobacteria bacterium]|nr:hypothetical protein [Deltaproteobacteria bacterium]